MLLAEISFETVWITNLNGKIELNFYNNPINLYNSYNLQGAIVKNKFKIYLEVFLKSRQSFLEVTNLELIRKDTNPTL